METTRGVQEAECRARGAIGELPVPSQLRRLKTDVTSPLHDLERFPTRFGTHLFLEI